MFCSCCEEENTKLTPVLWFDKTMDICSFCFKNYNPKHIHSVFDKQTLPFQGEHSLYFGVELELNVKQNEDDPTLGMENICTLEYQLEPFIKNKDITLYWDMTIEGDGFEIVSAPMNLPYQNELWTDIYANIDTTLFGNMHDCGTHIHFSKNYMTPTESDLLMLFLHIHNTYAYQIGKRQSRYAQLQSISDMKSLHSFKRWVEDNNKEKEIGYNFIGLPTNELRIFRATKYKKDMLAYLKWTHQLIHFIKKHSATYLEKMDLSWLTLENFECFIKSN